MQMQPRTEHLDNEIHRHPRQPHPLYMGRSWASRRSGHLPLALADKDMATLGPLNHDLPGLAVMCNGQHRQRISIYFTLSLGDTSEFLAISTSPCVVFLASTKLKPHYVATQNLNHRNLNIMSFATLSLRLYKQLNS